MPAVYTVPIFATGALGAFLNPVLKDRERSSPVQPGLA